MVTSEFKDKVKAAINLKELAEEHTELVPMGDDVWGGHCPHPDHEDSTASFRVWHNKDGSWTWSCMGCHCDKKDLEHHSYGSDCIAFVQWMSDHKGSKHRKTFLEAVKELADKAGIPMEHEKHEEEYKFLAIQARCYHANLFPGIRKYLYERGLDDSDIDAWQIGFNARPEKQSGGRVIPRIMFPLLARHGRVLGFSARKLPEAYEGAPKYLNSATSEWFQKRSYFYGGHLIEDDCDEIRIVEGVVDVILAHKYGVKNVVAPLGTAFTEDHACMVKNLGKTPVFCMDGDSAGEKAAEKSVRMMANIGVYSKVCTMPHGMDMADLANREKSSLESWVKANTVLYWEYRLREPSNEFSSALSQLRMKMLPAIKEAFEGVQEPDEKLMFKSYVKERFGIAL